MKTTPFTIERAENVLMNATEALENATTKNRMCITAWLDLLGFSQHLNSDFFDFDTESNLGLKRIATFHEISLQSMNDISHIVQLNDATIFSYDIKGTNIVAELSEFFARLDSFWEIANLSDKKIGGYGVRGVISLGYRYNLRGNFGWTPNNMNVKDPNFISPTPIMMNMSFAKSYYLESSKKLRRESSLYIESRILTDFQFQIMETWEEHEKIFDEKVGEYTLIRYENEP